MEGVNTTIQRVVVVHSPRSGRSAQLARALASLRAAGIELLDVLPISQIDGLPPQGEKWRAQGADCVVAAGGDGLIGGVISHIIPGDLLLGILPLGTANDVARTVGIPIDPVRAVEVILHGKRDAIDIGSAQPAEQEPHAFSEPGQGVQDEIPANQSMYFAHALTVGLNVQFARIATRASVRKQYGSMTYPYAVYQALRSYKHISATLDFEGLLMREDNKSPLVHTDQNATLRCNVAQVTVVNAPVFWGALEARVPGVSLNDRALDIVVIEDSVLQNLFFRVTRFFSRQRHSKPDSWHARYPELLHAQLTNVPGVHHIQARAVHITTKERIDATLDGEVRGHTPIHARVASELLNLIVPATS